MIMRSQQQGATLLVSLIILVLMTLLGVSSFMLGKSNMQTVGNMQQRNEAMAAAQETVEETVSKTQFFETPTNAVPNGCAANTKCVDVNADGKSDVTVVLATPKCVQAQVVQNAALNYANAEDAGCAIGAGQGLFGVEGATTGNSLCADSVWELSAEATDDVTESKVTVTQGAAVRVSTDNIATSCPI
jgi:Tfp pilus assembly protein PilX